MINLNNTIFLRLAWTVIISVFNLMADEGIKDVKQHPQSKNIRWNTSPNWITELPEEEQKYLCGTIPESHDDTEINLLSIQEPQTLPLSFDWRNHQGNWLTEVKDQGLCGSCWSFCAVAQTESWWKIKVNRPYLEIDLSEQFILSCSEGTCKGGRISHALDLIKTSGIPAETLSPYQASDTIPCMDAGENWESNSIRIPGRIGLSAMSIEMIKRTIMRQPVSTIMRVYDNFFAYSNGVYNSPSDNYIGSHAVLLVGWDDVEQSWICKNSWGNEWGDEGYFRISWGICNIGSSVSYIWNSVINTPAIMVQPEGLDYTLSGGDSIQTNFTIKNKNADNLEYFITVCKPAFKTTENLLNHNQSAWLGISNRTGVIKGFDSVRIEIQVKSKHLDTGSFCRILRIDSNDKTQPVVFLRINLEVDSPNVMRNPDTRSRPFLVNQNYPNPFNPTTVISYQISVISDVELSIYNLLGQKITTLVSERQTAGVYKVEWNASEFPSLSFRFMF